MFSKLFGRTKTANQAIVDTLYAQIVEAGRHPVFYAQLSVPDTPLGRYEMVALHVFLFLHRTSGEPAPLSDIAQELTDEFFKDVEHSLRELGIGDMGVPKRMKKLARMFYGRADSYGKAIEAGDRAALAEAFRRNIVPGGEAWHHGPALADYAFACVQSLAGQPSTRISAGKLDFPEPEPAHEEGS